MTARSVLATAAMTVLMLGAACSGGSEGSVQAFCDRAGKVEVVTTSEELVGPGGTRRAIELVTALEGLRDVAPEDIRGDVTTMVTVAGNLRDALAAEAGEDEAARSQTKDALTRSMAGFEPASDAVVAYTRKTCGINLGER